MGMYISNSYEGIDDRNRTQDDVFALLEKSQVRG